jgi:signal peptidase II
LNRQIRYWLFLLLIIGAVLAADQITKRIVVNDLRVGETRQIIPALSPFFQVTRSQNTGAAFGFLPQASDIFLIIAVVVVLVMLYYYPRISGDAWVNRLAVGLICGGALGNAVDRLTYGHVVDFIHYQIPGVISNVSNLGDHGIVLGVILLFIESWRAERAASKAASETVDTAPNPPTNQADSEQTP